MNWYCGKGFAPFSPMHPGLHWERRGARQQAGLAGYLELVVLDQPECHYGILPPQEPRKSMEILWKEDTKIHHLVFHWEVKVLNQDMFNNLVKHTPQIRLNRDCQVLESDFREESNNLMNIIVCQHLSDYQTLSLPMLTIHWTNSCAFKRTCNRKTQSLILSVASSIK